MFSNNIPVCDYTDTEYTVAILPCSGTLYSSNMAISFNGINIFSDNTASAIEVYGSVITINPDTSMCFIGNSGSYGGAIALYMNVVILYFIMRQS